MSSEQTAKTTPRKPRRGRAAGGLIPFGWQGVRGEVPADWNLGAIGGERKAGYVRLDDDEMPRMELKWQQPERDIDLDKILDNYLRDLRRRSRKQKAAFQVTRGVKILSRRQKRNKDLRGYTFTGEYDAHGIIWHCHTCGRVLISQVLGRGGSDLKSLAVRVLGTLEDHASDHWDLWTAYGMEFRLPDDFELAKHRLMTGQLQLDFARGKHEKLSLARWALANVMLKSKSLQEWAAKEYKTRHADFKLVYKETEQHHHEGIEVRSQAGRMARMLKDAARSSVLRQPVAGLRCALWHCTKENKLYAVDSELLPDHEPVLDYVVQSIDCH